jgi:hypothetical protein
VHEHFNITCIFHSCVRAAEPCPNGIYHEIMDFNPDARGSDVLVECENILHVRVVGKST